MKNYFGIYLLHLLSALFLTPSSSNAQVTLGDTVGMYHIEFEPPAELHPNNSTVSFGISVNGDQNYDFAIEASDSPVSGQHSNRFLIFNENIEVCRYVDSPFNGPHLAGTLKHFDWGEVLICEGNLEWVGYAVNTISWTGGGTWAGENNFTDGFYGLRFSDGENYIYGWLHVDNGPGLPEWKIKGWAFQSNPGDITSSMDNALNDLKGFQVYPNPFHTSLNIQVDSTSRNFNAHVFDTHGSLIFSFPVKSGLTILEPDHLSPGIYLLIFSDGSSSVFQKLIKR